VQGQDGATTFPLQMMSKMVINQSMPNISIGQPRDTSAAEASVVSHLHARWVTVTAGQQQLQ